MMYPVATKLERGKTVFDWHGSKNFFVNTVLLLSK